MCSANVRYDESVSGDIMVGNGSAGMSELTENKVRQIVREETADMRSDIGGLKGDVTGLKSDVAVLKTDVAELKTDVAVLKTDVAELKTDVRDLGVKFEHVDAKMDTIAELVTTTVRTRREVDDMGPMLDKLEGLYEVQRRVIGEHSVALKKLQRD